MLSEEVYKRVKCELANKPIHLSLLEHLWPLVKDFDFETDGSLEVKQPMHELLVFPSKLDRALGIRSPKSTGQAVPYSHRTIRRTVHMLGLWVDNKHKFFNGSFRILQEKPKKSKRKK